MVKILTDDFKKGGENMLNGVSEAAIFPTAETVYRQGEASIQLMPIQAMIDALARIYQNIGGLTVTGINDEKTVRSVKNLQKIFGQEQTGEIDAYFWEYLASLYRCTITFGRYRPDGAF